MKWNGIAKVCYQFFWLQVLFCSPDGFKLTYISRNQTSSASWMESLMLSKKILSCYIGKNIPPARSTAMVGTNSEGIGRKKPGWGYSPENVIWVHAALKTPFLCPPGCSLRPPCHNFSVPQGPTFAWNHKFLKICASKPQNRGKVQFLSLKFYQISVSWSVE